MTKQEIQPLADKTMENYSVKQVFATEDGQVFLNKNRAELHAKGKLVIYEFTAGDIPISEAAPVINAATLPSPEFRAKTKEELEAMNYNELMKLKATLKIDTVDNKKETLVNSIIEGQTAPEDIQS